MRLERGNRWMSLPASGLHGVLTLRLRCARMAHIPTARGARLHVAAHLDISEWPSQNRAPHAAAATPGQVPLTCSPGERAGRRPSCAGSAAGCVQAGRQPAVQPAGWPKAALRSAAARSCSTDRTCPQGIPRFRQTRLRIGRLRFSPLDPRVPPECGKAILQSAAAGHSRRTIGL